MDLAYSCVARTGIHVHVDDHDQLNLNFDQKYYHVTERLTLIQHVSASKPHCLVTHGCPIMRMRILI